MDYEKAYKAVLQTATQWIKDGCTDKEKICLESVFPELRESEDERNERIRKAIVHLLEVASEAYLIDATGFKKAQFLAYLEKQKENPKTADSIPSDCASDAKCGNSRHKVGDSLEGRKLADEVVAYLIKSGYQPIIKDTLDKKHFQIKIPRHKKDFFQSKEYKHCREILDEYYYEGDFAGDVYTLYVLRQKEQKPPIAGNDFGWIDELKHDLKHPEELDEKVQEVLKKRKKSVEWSKDDDVFLNEIIDFFENGTVRLQHDLSMYAHWLKSLPERFVLQPKQEWSEEDEHRRTDAIYFLESAKGHYADTSEIEKTISWLKSLRPQSKDEIYKEKDEAFKLGKHQLAIKFMNYLDENRPEDKMCLSNGECEEIDKAFKENDWAKIMRYIEKYRPSWKPSEEQMQALNYFIKLWGNSDDQLEYTKIFNTVKSLRDDLKKLM